MRLKKTTAWVLAFLVAAVVVTGMAQAQDTPPGNEILETGRLYLPAISAAVIPPTPVPTRTPTQGTQPTLPPPALTNIIDQSTLPLYDQIPANYLDLAERIRFTFMDRSVGANINDGLTCLAASSWADSASICRRDYIDSSLTTWKTFTSSDAHIPAQILFPGGNSRANIAFVYHEATWEEDLQYFIDQYSNYAGSTEIFTFQHNYLHVDNGTGIAANYFNSGYGGTNIYDVLALEALYPNKTFVYWTTSLARTIGTAEAQSFNDQMRAWARANHKILIDVAAIESHTPGGVPCVNAQGYEILCQEYTTETAGGHLGSVSAGKLRIAKAIWITLAQLAGWGG